MASIAERIVERDREEKQTGDIRENRQHEHVYAESAHGVGELECVEMQESAGKFSLGRSTELTGGDFVANWSPQNRA